MQQRLRAGLLNKRTINCLIILQEKVKFDGKLPTQKAEFIRMVLALARCFVAEVANKISTLVVIKRLFDWLND